MKPAYLYSAVVKKVYDGDTIYVDWDMGDGIWQINEPVRLYGIQAPEVRGPQKWFGGFKSRDILKEKIILKEIVMKTFRLKKKDTYKIHDKHGKYGRILGIIYCDGVNMNDWMVDNGYAKEYKI
jgi:micrococcal nuclease